MISFNYQNHQLAYPGSYDPSKIPAPTPSYQNFSQQRVDQKSPSTYMYCPMLTTSTELSSPKSISLPRTKECFNEHANKLKYSHSPDSPPPTPTVNSELARARTNFQPFTHFYTPNTTPVKMQSKWSRSNLYHPRIFQYHQYPSTPQAPTLQPMTMSLTTNSGFFNQFNEPLINTVKITKKIIFL